MMWHPGLSYRVSEFTKEQQLLMICNELNRARNNRDYPEEYKNCLERAIELTDIFSCDPRWDTGLRELRRARRLIAQQYIHPECDDTTWLQDVFLKLYSKAANTLRIPVDEL